MASGFGFWLWLLALASGLGFCPCLLALPSGFGFWLLASAFGFCSLLLPLASALGFWLWLLPLPLRRPRRPFRRLRRLLRRLRRPLRRPRPAHARLRPAPGAPRGGCAVHFFVALPPWTRCPACLRFLRGVAGFFVDFRGIARRSAGWCGLALPPPPPSLTTTTTTRISPHFAGFRVCAFFSLPGRRGRICVALRGFSCDFGGWACAAGRD